MAGQPGYPQRDAGSDTGHWNFSICVDRFGNIAAAVKIGGGPGAGSHETGASAAPATVARLLREIAADVERAGFRLPDGTWSCTRDHATRPCGDCGGCRHIASLNRARRQAAT